MASADLPLASLDDRQRAAAEHAHGPLAVIAGAGTGKTRVLVARVAWLIAEGHARPGEICALTFMNDSAREIAERLKRALGAQVAGQITVGTSHRLANSLLRGCAERFARRGRYSIWDSNQARRALTQALAASAEETAPPVTVAKLATEAAQRLQAMAEVLGAAQPYLGEDLRALALISLGYAQGWTGHYDQADYLA